jgi:predicted phosphodiesterase
MHSNLAGRCGYLLLVALLVCSSCTVNIDTDSEDFQHNIASDPTPWTHEQFDAEKDQFTFAVFSDLYGGERDQIFEIAMQQLSLLRPELIMSVGDLIEGGTEDREQLAREWDEFDAKSATTRAPVFYVGGNHDLTNLTMRDVWMQRHGARYYHFVYKNVLFLILDSEDFDDQRMQEVYHARASALEEFKTNPDEWMETEYFAMQERRTGAVRAEQSAYIRKAIANNPGVTWTFLFMHKQVWKNENATEFQAIEAALSDRPYTVFSGHLHSYSLNERNGRDYIVLGTTSGSQNAKDEMAFDHVTMVAMSKDGPTIANLRMDGILDKTGHIPLDGDQLCYQASRCNAAETQ